MSRRRFKLAAAQYPIDWLDGWQAYVAKLTGWVEAAVAQGSQLLVFPEYGAMELASLFPDPVPGDLHRQLGVVAELEAPVVELHQGLARRHGVHILGASLPAEVATGRFHNRAWLYGPDGAKGCQDKIVMTPFEREQWGVSAASGLRLFETTLGRIGVCICDDVEFPLLAWALADAGAELILAPSCTETLQGYWRVRVGSQARALENQCLVVQAPTVGEARWSPAVDRNRGAAGIYGPPDLGFPDDGVLTTGVLDAPSWVYAEVDLARVAEVREAGAVLNRRHWPEQADAARSRVDRVSV
jgi:predicted amidohydrolase